MMVKKKSVLIVSSNQELISALSSVCQILGLRPYYSTRVKEAVVKSRNQKFDLVLFDSLVNGEKIYGSLKEIFDQTGFNKGTKGVLLEVDKQSKIENEGLPFVSGIILKPYDSQKLATVFHRFGLI